MPNQTRRFFIGFTLALPLAFALWLGLGTVPGVGAAPPSASPEAATGAAEAFVRTLADRRIKANRQPPVLLRFPLTPETVTPDPTDPELWWLAGDAWMGAIPLRWRLIERRDSRQGWQCKSVEIWTAQKMLPL